VLPGPEVAGPYDPAMTSERLHPGPAATGRRPSSISASVLLFACWWAYVLAADIALLAEVGGAGNWLALGGCTVAVGFLLRGLRRGGPAARRVAQRLALGVPLAFFGGAATMLLFGPRLGSLITSPVEPVVLLGILGALLALLALLASGLLLRTASARAWCER
jgi:hypothetical protein